MLKNYKKLPFKALFSVFILGFFVCSYAAAAEGISPKDVIALVNNSRKSAGLSDLSENSFLSRAARAKADDMLKNDYFAHTSPDGTEPWHWFKKSGYEYKFAGENLAINFNDSREQHKAWMKSETHKKNILSDNYQEIGVAVVEGKIGGKNSILTVQLFGAPLAVPAVRDKKEALAGERIEPAIKGAENEAVFENSYLSGKKTEALNFSDADGSIFKIILAGFAAMLFLALAAERISRAVKIYEMAFLLSQKIEQR